MANAQPELGDGLEVLRKVTSLRMTEERNMKERLIGDGCPLGSWGLCCHCWRAPKKKYTL
jgi:hypothetical protein